jgi:hypothetical protein
VGQAHKGKARRADNTQNMVVRHTQCVRHIKGSGSDHTLTAPPGGHPPPSPTPRGRLRTIVSGAQVRGVRQEAGAAHGVAAVRDAAQDNPGGGAGSQPRATAVALGAPQAQGGGVSSGRCSHCTGCLATGQGRQARRCSPCSPSRTWASGSTRGTGTKVHADGGGRGTSSCDGGRGGQGQARGRGGLLYLGRRAQCWGCVGRGGACYAVAPTHTLLRLHVHLRPHLHVWLRLHVLVPTRTSVAVRQHVPVFVHTDRGGTRWTLAVRHGAVAAVCRLAGPGICGHNKGGGVGYTAVTNRGWVRGGGWKGNGCVFPCVCVCECVCARVGAVPVRGTSGR